MSDRARRIGALAAWSARRARLVLACGLLLAGVCAVWAATSLEFRSDRSSLVDTSLDWQQRYLEFKRTFPNWDDAILVTDLNEDAARDAFTHLDAAFDTLGGFPDRTLWYDTREARAPAALLEDDADLRATVAELTRSSALLTPGVTLESALRGARLSGQTQALLSLVVGSLKGAPSVLEPDPRGFFRVGGMTIGYVPLGTSATGGSVNDVASRVSTLRETIVWSEDPITGFLPFFDNHLSTIGVTGIPVIESDETAQSTFDAALASSISFVLIALLLAFVYRGVLVPLCALGALLIGVAWSFGWVMAGVGHLQVLSVVFAVILLGLGVDGAIHLIARLELVHPDHDHMASAVGRAAEGVGPGIVTGALTTAAAFGATALSPFTGVAEMGLIAAGGVVLCTGAILLALPALLALQTRPERRLRTRAGGASRPFAGRLGLWIDRHPGKVFGASATVMLVAALCAGGVLTSPVRYDPDLIALMPPNAEGVVWERRLSAADGRTPWHAVVVASDRAEAERLTVALRALPEVSSVGGAAVLFPGGGALERRAALLRSLPEVSFTPGSVTITSSRVRDFRGLLLDLGVDEESYTDADIRRTLGAFERDRARLAERIGALRTVGARVEASDLPEAVRDRFVSPTGAYLLRVYPAAVGGASGAGDGGVGPLHPDRLGPFVEAVLRTAPGATGPSVQVYESTKVILRGYAFAAIFAAIAIVALLLLDFRSLADTLCAVLPVAVGLVLLLGAMAALGVALNFANTIVMPLIIGLGVDAGVHAVHRWRTQPGDAPAGLAGGTGRAITLTTLTTAIGFACMMIGEHRGVRSLGLVMSMGLVFVWVASVFVLPPVLRLRTRESSESAGTAPR